VSGRLPLTVIGGFLGAGKTTLLKRWLQGHGGRRIAVLVNDFGALNIDAALVASAGADTIALSNGCACCSIGDDLGAALTRVIDAHPRFDAVVIEASGVSDPWRIAQVGLADPALSLQAVLVLVDAAAVLDQAADPLLADSLARQLQAADLVVVNKIDLVDAASLERVHRWLDGLVPGRPRVDVQEADVPALLRDGPRLPLAAPAVHDHDHDHDTAHATQFETWSAQPAGTFSSAALRGALRDMPPGVLRLKGWLPTDTLGWAEWQYAGRHGSLRRLPQPPADGAAVVAIGLRGRLPRPALTALLADAALPASSAAGP
jgi:G3E family GTPase